jgi:alpha-N-arabinofuranosidase
MVPFQTGSTESGRINFGTDEALQFAQSIGGELMITVNVGTGTPAEAADWVRYVNAQGLRVRFWEVGNEVYIQGGPPQSVVAMDAVTYASRFLQFARAMRAVDPNIKIGAIGGQNRGAYNIVSDPNWDQILLQTAGSEIDFLSVHNAYAPVNVSDSDDFRDVYGALLAAPALIADNLHTVASQIAAYAPSRVSQIAIAVTEWGPLFQMNTGGRFAQHTRTLGSALFAADTLKALIESPATQIANFNVLNDLSIMCWLCSEGGIYPPVWTPTAESQAFQMFHQHFGTQLVSSAVAGPQYSNLAIGFVPATSGVQYLDVVSSLSADGRSLYLIGINKHFDNSIAASVSIRGFTPSASAVSWTLNGAGIDSNTGTAPLQAPGVYWAPQAEDPQNPQFYNGAPGQVAVAAGLVNAGPDFIYIFPPHSVTALQLDLDTFSQPGHAKPIELKRRRLPIGPAG